MSDDDVLNISDWPAIKMVDPETVRREAHDEAIERMVDEKLAAMCVSLAERCEKRAQERRDALRRIDFVGEIEADRVDALTVASHMGQELGAAAALMEIAVWARGDSACGDG